MVTLVGSAAWTLTTTSCGFGGGLFVGMLAQLTKKIPRANKIKIFLTMTHSPSIFICFFHWIVYLEGAKSVPNLLIFPTKIISLIIQVVKRCHGV
jgi:hypothetical protein